jgi:sugar-specific transcriptional regulator TrmB
LSLRELNRALEELRQAKVDRRERIAKFILDVISALGKERIKVLGFSVEVAPYVLPEIRKISDEQIEKVLSLTRQLLSDLNET